MTKYFVKYLTSVVVFAVVSFQSASGLDCFSCANEHHNWNTCTKKMVQCKSFQDACTSYTSFHRFIDYSPRGEKWHNISKGCDTMEGCEKRAAAVNDALCERSSWKEWACIECCRGDLCNYFVTLGSPRLFKSFAQTLTMLACLAAILVTLNRGHNRL